MKWMIPLPLLMLVACQVPNTASTAKNQVEVAPASARQDSRQAEEESTVVVYALNNANAGSMESVLGNLLPNRRGAQFRVIADHRLNAVVLSGSKKQIEQAIVLLDQLDVPTPQQD